MITTYKNTIRSGRRAFLLGLTGFTMASCFRKPNSSASSARETDRYLDEESVRDREGLRQIAAEKGIIYGGFHQRDPVEFPQDAEFQRIFAEEYGLLVGGFFGVTVGPFGENNYDFSQVEPFYDYARQHDLIFRATPMIWNEFNSPWVVEKFKSPDTTSAEIERIFVDIISTFGRQYAGRVHSWDVVNEIIMVEDGRADNLKDTTISGVRGEKYRTWLHFLGPGYIERAFRIAAAADPNAILVLNENGLTYSNAFGNSYWEKRRTAVLKLLERLIAKGAPVHALGIQSHLLGHHNQDFDAKKFRQFLSDVASMGLEIYITELDVADNELPQDIKTRDRLVAEAYYDYLSVVLDEPAVTMVINWGLNDRHSWLSYFAPRKDGAEVRPLLLDRQYNRKLAWKAVAKALQEAPAR